MLANQSEMKLDSKLRLISMLYLKKENCILQNRQQGHKARYLISLNSQANLKFSLAKICQLFTDTIYQVNAGCQSIQNIASLRFNLFFQFMVKLYYLQDCFLPNTSKDTQASLVIQNQIIKNLSYSFRTNEQIKQDFRKYLGETCKLYIDEQLRNQSKQDEIFIKLKKIRNKLIQIYKTDILSLAIDNQSTLKRRRFYIPAEMQTNPQLFLTKKLQTIIDLRFTKKKYRLLLFQNYINNYRHFFQAKIYRIKQQQTQIVNKFTIRRYSNLKIDDSSSPDQMLITIQNLIRIRPKSDINNAEDIEIIRMLGNQLVRHKKITGCHYPILSPKQVIFNQLSLQTQLSYYPPILEGLGFLKKPCSIQQLIAFKGTPEPFDPFAAPNEMLLDNGIQDQIFYNYLYGMDALLQKDQQKSKKGKSKSLIVPQAEGKTMSQIKQYEQSYSQMWRYIMVSSYIMNNKVFSQEYVSSLSSFKQFLKKQAFLIKKDKVKFIQTVLGNKFTQHLHQHKHQSLKNQRMFKMSLFDNFLRKNTEHFDQNIQFQRYKKYIVERNEIMSMITQTLKRNQKQKYINMEKYFALAILFYLNSYQYLTNIRLILNLAFKDIFLVKQLLIDTEICKILYFNDKSKGIIKSIQKSWEALSSVKEKSKDKKHRLYSVFQSYKKIFSQIDQIRKKCFFCHERIKKQYVQGFAEENHSTYKKILSEIHQNIVFCLQSVLQICQKQVACKNQGENTLQVDKYIISLSLTLKIKYFLFHTTQNSIKLGSVRENLYLDKDSQNNQRTIEILEYCHSILRQQEKTVAQLKEELMIR